MRIRRIFSALVTIFIFVVVAYMLGFCSRESSKKQYPKPVYEESDFYGVAKLTGYTKLEEVNEAFCFEDCDTYLYLFFNILETDDDFLFGYLGEESGNAYVGDKSIGLGCIFDGIIKYENDSDEFGMTEYKLPAELSKYILNSTRKNPITIEVEKYKYTGGRDAPTCYSHISKIRLP